MSTLSEFLSGLNINSIVNLISNPSFQTFQSAAIIYAGLLWLAIIVWVTRDAIQRSDSLLFQVIAILLNILFPVLGILLYLIIRPAKTSTERYYEELEHQLILESIHEKEGVEKEAEAGEESAKKTVKRIKKLKSLKTEK